MKINDIKALDYQEQDSKLILHLADTSLEQITSMDTALLQVTTDDGDLVDAFAGYYLSKATYEATDGTFMVTLNQGAGDTTAAALAALTEQNTALQQQVAEQQTRLDEQDDALIELADLLAGEEV